MRNYNLIQLPDGSYTKRINEENPYPRLHFHVQCSPDFALVSVHYDAALHISSENELVNLTYDALRELLLDNKPRTKSALRVQMNFPL